MDKQSLPSIEKFASFLDGNFSQDEMQQFFDLADKNAALRQLIKASSIIDDALSSVKEQDSQFPDEITNSEFELPDLDNIDDSSSAGDSFLDLDNLYIVEDIDLDDSLDSELETSKNNNIMEELLRSRYETTGEHGENVSDPVYVRQPDDHSCALRSQQIVLRDFGIDIPFKDLERIALDAGVYSNEGTYTYDIGKVLELAGVGMHQVPGSSLYDLTNELAHGHRVIVSVDADELWYNDSFTDKLKNWLNDAFTVQGGNHALIVAGVEVNPNNPKDINVVLTDPGTGDLRIEYPINQFMSAWRDSNCFMAATNDPAPYQYDIVSGKEIPSNFMVEQHINEFIANNSYQLSPDMINIPDGYQPAFTGHFDLVGDMTFDEFNDSFNAHMASIEPLSFSSVKELIEEQVRKHLDGIEDEEVNKDNEVSYTNGITGETTGSVGADSGETTGGVGTSFGSDNPDDLDPPSDYIIGETTGGVGTDSGEGSGGVGSDSGESSGGVGSDSEEDDDSDDETDN